MLNVGIIHKECSEERLQKWQDENQETVVEPGDYVKIGFTDGKESEWMWVEITEAVSQDKFKGNLSNDPILFIDSLKYGDEFEFERKEISQLIKKDDF